jgi:hypothetical protein
VSETLGSHRVPNTEVLSSLSLRLLMPLSHFGLLQPAETAPALSPVTWFRLPSSGRYYAEPSLECSLHNHTKIHQQVIRHPFWLIDHYPSPLFRSLLTANLNLGFLRRLTTQLKLCHSLHLIKVGFHAIKIALQPQSIQLLTSLQRVHHK